MHQIAPPRRRSWIVDLDDPHAVYRRLMMGGVVMASPSPVEVPALVSVKPVNFLELPLTQAEKLEVKAILDEPAPVRTCAHVDADLLFAELTRMTTDGSVTSTYAQLAKAMCWSHMRISAVIRVLVQEGRVEETRRHRYPTVFRLVGFNPKTSYTARCEQLARARAAKAALPPKWTRETAVAAMAKAKILTGRHAIRMEASCLWDEGTQRAAGRIEGGLPSYSYLRKIFGSMDQIRAAVDEYLSLENAHA